MARTVRWTEPALADVTAIAAHIGRDSRHYAATFVSRIYEAPENVTLFPEVGALIPKHERPDLREIFVGRHRLIYRFTTDEVLVLAVIHSARKLERAWRPDWIKRPSTSER